MNTLRSIGIASLGLALLVMSAVLVGFGGATSSVAAPQAQATSPTGYNVSARFQEYYGAHDGERLLGFAVSNELTLTATEQITGGQRTISLPAQYFQKGRLEDQRGRGYTGDWAFTFGLLVPELIEKGSEMPVSNTKHTYRQLQAYYNEFMVNPPEGFVSGVYEDPSGTHTFIPQDSLLRKAPGYNVPDYFWDFMNGGVFPAGWLHDLGLPVTADFETTVVKDGETRAIHMQAFERGVLTYDQKNPVGFLVERGNVGYDYLVEFGVEPGTPGGTAPGATNTAQPSGTAVATGTAEATGSPVATGTAVATGSPEASTTAVASSTAAASATTSPVATGSPEGTNIPVASVTIEVTTVPEVTGTMDPAP